MTDQTTSKRRSVPGGRHSSHVGAPSLSERERKLAVYELQRERPNVYLSLIESCRHDGHRQVLTALYTQDGVVTYDDLEAFVNRHRRKIKKHVGNMADDGILRRGGNPAVVTFADTDVALLASDTLNLTDPL